MANLVKTKTALASVSIILIILIPLLESGFMRPVVIKRWTKLTWDDFQGFPKPFSRYDAAINSDIYLEYDSTLKRYHAYAAQNNIESWVRTGYEPPTTDYLLIHEQYHFNITESFARKVDKIIQESPNEDYSYYIGKVVDAQYDLWDAQRKYDRETSHGTLLGRQKRWEFQVDSLLKGESGWLIDDFSGASVFLPTDSLSTFKKRVTKQQVKSRDYYTEAYEMTFHLLSMQHWDYDDSSMFRVMKQMKNNKNMEMLRMDLQNYPQKVLYHFADSTGKITYSSWTYDGSNLYYVDATFWGNSRDTTGYYEIANSVIRSFRIANVDTMLLDNKKPLTEIKYSTLKDKKSAQPGTEYVGCFVKRPRTSIGFITKPVFDNDSLYIACDFSAVPDSLRYEDFLQIDNEMMAVSPSKDGQRFHVNASSIANGAHVLIGYLLKEDTTKECFQSYRDILDLRH